MIELKRDANPKVVINNLFKHTQLETTFSVNSLAIDHGKPKTLNLKGTDPVLHRTSPRGGGPAHRFELRKAENAPNCSRGYLCALSNLDEFIRSSAARRTATRPR